LRVCCGVAAADALVDEYEVLHGADPTPGPYRHSKFRDYHLKL
jgi:hypothetical protein